MTVTKSWLSEWIDLTGVTTNDICKTLNAIGLEVDGVMDYTMPKKLVFGRVLECERHPDADKLSVCQVDIGSSVRQIVCGAENVRAGIDVVVATIGAEMPDGLKIKPVKLRGVDSEGMICSAKEIGFPNCQDGILELDASIGTYNLGDEICENPIFNDSVIDIELTANRGDCLSVSGIARDLSAALDKPMILQKEHNNDNKKGIGRLLNLSYEKNIDVNLSYKVFELKNLVLPLKVKLRLAQIDEQRDTDIESLLLYTTQTSGVILRAYNFGYFCNENDIMAKVELYKDENGFAALRGQKQASVVGVMQNKESRVTYAEGIVLLEASYVSPELISKQMSEHKIEACPIYYNTSRGSEPDLACGISHFLNVLEESSDSSSFSGSIEYGKSYDARIISIHKKEIDQFIGTSVTQANIAKILKNLGFDTSKSSSGNFVINVPQFRHDIVNKQDIVEEIVRMVGIDNIESKPFKFSEENRLDDDYHQYKKRTTLRQRSAYNGFYETVHFVFDEKKVLQNYGFDVVDEKFELINPIVNTLDTLRTTLLTGLLRAASNNVKAGFSQVKLFEIGSVFDSKRNETLRFSALFSGKVQDEKILNGGKPSDIAFGEFVQKIANIIGPFELVASKTEHSLSHMFQSANLIVNGQNIGELFRVHPNVEQDYGLGPTYVCEIEFDKIAFDLKKAKEVSKYQASVKDLSLVIPQSMTYKEVKSVIESAEINDLVRFYPVDDYTDESLGENISLSIRFILQSKEKTLSEEDITSSMNAIQDVLKSRLGVGLRE